MVFPSVQALLLNAKVIEEIQNLIFAWIQSWCFKKVYVYNFKKSTNCTLENGRLSIVLGSSTLHNIWKEKTYKPSTHIDFDCIIGKTFFYTVNECCSFSSTNIDVQGVRSMMFMNPFSASTIRSIIPWTSFWPAGSTTFPQPIPLKASSLSSERSWSR